MASRTILLVEGIDDMHVIEHICLKRNIPVPEEVKPHDGDQDLLRILSTQLKTSTEEGDVVAAVIDADKDVQGRWQAISKRLSDAGYENVPSEPDPQGTILDSPEGSILPTAGVWVMPNNQDAGKLEEFLMSLVPSQDTLIAHATEVVEQLPYKRFKDKDEVKAIMHTWLAWQESPGRPYGTAIRASFLDATVPAADGLVCWLNRLSQG